MENPLLRLRGCYDFYQNYRLEGPDVLVTFVGLREASVAAVQAGAVWSLLGLGPRGVMGTPRATASGINVQLLLPPGQLIQHK